MSVECKCESCPFDIRVLGYPTAKEDAAFEGTQCLWHEHIVGKRGWIFVSGGTAKEPLFISQKNDGTYTKEDFGLSEVRSQARAIGAKLR